MTFKKILFCLALSTSCVAFAGSTTHKVARGETLYGIANTYHTSVAEIRALNGLKSSRINPGQVLSVPAASGLSELATEAPTRTQTSYTVRRGDSLSIIAARLGVSVATLRSQNNLRGNLIQPGQVLFASSSAKSEYTAPVQVKNKPVAATHVVRRGDSLWLISKRYRVSMASLASYNGIGKNSALVPGQQIRIPGGSQIAQQAAPKYDSSRNSAGINLESRSVMVVDAATGKPLYQKNADVVKPIASITKLMTAMVTLDARLPMDEILTIDGNDLDRLKGTSSRLPLGTRLTRRDMLHLALMSSENRAASALSRHYPGGKSAFIAAMNNKARALGMGSSSFRDATGLTPKNVSTAQDLAKMVAAASQYPLIREFTTDKDELMHIAKAGTLQYRNTNPLVHQSLLGVKVSKTGYINEAGRCLVMQATIGSRPAYMVFLQSGGRYSPSNDAKRVAKWIESGAAGINLAAL